MLKPIIRWLDVRTSHRAQFSSLLDSPLPPELARHYGVVNQEVPR